jgi:hypothetical protein
VFFIALSVSVESPLRLVFNAQHNNKHPELAHARKEIDPANAFSQKLPGSILCMVLKICFEEKAAFLMSDTIAPAFYSAPIFSTLL